jgi:ATP-dependent Clp protease ATP-binding subunit ClpA
MFDKFTDLAKRSIVLSQDEAISLGHDFIGTEHLMLGLVGVPEGIAGQVLNERGITAEAVRAEAVRILEAANVPATGGRAATEALATIGIDVDEIRRRAEENFGPGRFYFPRPAYTEDAKTALKYTLREATALGHDDIGTEHMLLGLIAADQGAGIQTLTALGTDPAALRQDVLARLTRQRDG